MATDSRSNADSSARASHGPTLREHAAALTREARELAWRGVLPWTLGLALVTAVLSRFRDQLDEAHKTLAFLLLVLGASARHGRVAGFVLALFSFFAFNYFLLPPYHTLAIADPLDWWVLIGFLLTSAVAAQLFHRARSAQAMSEMRARDIERLTALAAESLAAPTAADAVLALAHVIRSELGVAWVEVVALEAGVDGDPKVIARSPEGRGSLDPQLVRFSVSEGRLVARGTDTTSHIASPGAELREVLQAAGSYEAVIVPLRIRERAIGALGLADPSGLRLDQARVLFAEALIYYAALAVERVQLASEVEHIAALEEADRLKDALLTSVSHDLRSPLTTIRALASELRSEDDERPLIIEEEADRLNRLVADLLDLSRIRVGGLPLDLQIVAAEDLVGAALQRLGGLAGSEKIQVRLPADGSLPVGRIDFVQSLRALGNLLENALKHAGDATVELEVRVDGEDLLFRILDRGEGVPPSERDRIFEPFFQAGERPRNGRGGAGMGLAIARSVAEAQGGAVRYLPRPGGGSVFELRLPGASLES